GAAGADPTVTVAVPLRPAPLAWTVAVPLPEVGALYRPLLLTVPMPPLATVQVHAGCVLMALPNWSLAVAVNCWLPPLATEAVPGVTLTLVSVWLTVTVTLLVVVS